MESRARRRHAARLLRPSTALIRHWCTFGEHRYGERKAIIEAEDWEGPSFQASADAAMVPPNGSSNTVSRFEAGEELKPRTIAAIRAALEKAGIVFIAENGGGAGVRLRKVRNKKGK